MKISPKHFPPISMFCQKKVSFDLTPIKPTEEQIRVLRKLLHALVIEGRKNIFTLSDSIQNLLAPNREKLMDAYWKDPQKESFSGAYIETQMTVPSIELFRFDPNRLVNPKTGVEEDCLRYTFASVQGQNVVVSMGIIDLFYEGNNDYVLLPHINTVKTPEREQEIINCQNYMLYLLNACTFLKYADVEVINVYGNQRKQLPDKSDIIENKSGVRVQYIDSRWIREIIRLEGFKVRGHFRLQPIKDEEGEWTRKLIYINEFEKHGYHRRALKMLENNPNYA